MPQRSIAHYSTTLPGEAILGLLVFPGHLNIWQIFVDTNGWLSLQSLDPQMN
jgi:hypothetical protein